MVSWLQRLYIRRTMIVPETKAMVIAMLTLSESQSTSVVLPSVTSSLEPPRPSPEPEPAANDNRT